MLMPDDMSRNARGSSGTGTFQGSDVTITVRHFYQMLFFPLQNTRNIVMD